VGFARNNPTELFNNLLSVLYYMKFNQAAALTRSRPVACAPLRAFNYLIFIGAIVAFIAGCDSDLRTEEPEPIGTPGEPPVDDIPVGEQPDAIFTLSASDTIQLREGAGSVEIPVKINRTNTADQTISLAVNTSVQDAERLTTTLSDSSLTPGETDSAVRVALAIGPYPIQAETRELTITAENTAGLTRTTTVNLQITPTDRPDVYLLIGQSNMVGSSEPDAKQATPGGPDEPDSRILQLNVTGNDQGNFASDADFTDPAKLFNNGQPLTPAIDPLHAGFEGNGGKSGDTIGLGLTFAKSALAETTADIYLVPAAWSATGFCLNTENPMRGWNASVSANGALGGTLLFDRAVARTNITLERTDGILRGILWHQGEADSNEPACAEAYADNLQMLVESIRSSIATDARGESARGPDADIPFIAGTMSKGGSMVPFSTTKLLVDSAHRNIASSVSFAGVVNADDLVPPAYPCGAGSCIHFGSTAYRELGRRYYELLRSIARQ
jgi:hypothetical protein